MRHSHALIQRNRSLVTLQKQRAGPREERVATRARAHEINSISRSGLTWCLLASIRDQKPARARHFERVLRVVGKDRIALEVQKTLEPLGIILRIPTSLDKRGRRGSGRSGWCGRSGHIPSNNRVQHPPRGGLGSWLRCLCGHRPSQRTLTGHRSRLDLQNDLLTLCPVMSPGAGPRGVGIATEDRNPVDIRVRHRARPGRLGLPRTAKLLCLALVRERALSNNGDPPIQSFEPHKWTVDASAGAGDHGGRATDLHALFGWPCRELIAARAAAIGRGDDDFFACNEAHDFCSAIGVAREARIDGACADSLFSAFDACVAAGDKSGWNVVPGRRRTGRRAIGLIGLGESLDAHHRDIDAVGRERAVASVGRSDVADGLHQLRP